MQDWIAQSDSALRFGARVMLVGPASLAHRCPRFWALIVSFIFTLPIYAQPNAETPAVETGEIGQVRKAPTEIVLLRDKNGNLVKVATNLSLEEYLRIYNQQNDVEDQNAPPDFAIEQAVYTGRATQTHLNFTGEFRIQLVQATQDQWVKIPLSLSKCVMNSAPKYSGNGEFFVTWDKQLGQVVWLKGAVNSQHVLTLNLTRPLRQSGQITELMLSLPAARSQFRQLIVPLSKARPVAGELDVKVTSPSNVTTSFAFDFQTSDLVFGWSDSSLAMIQPLNRLEAQVDTAFTVLQNRNISAISTITVNALNGEISNFEVDLPPRMQLLDLPSQSYRVTRVSGAEAEDPIERQRIRVSVIRPEKEFALTLQAEIPRASIDSSELDQSFSGFEVVNAIKQSGTLTVSTTSNWDVVWQASGDIRRTPRELESMATNSGVRQVAFEFYNTAYTIVGTLQERENQLRIVPRYLLEVSPTQLRMTSRLRCLYTGAGQYQILGDWAGWELDQVFRSREGVLELVDTELVDGNLQFPLVSSESETRGEVELVIRARRELPDSQEGESQLLDLVIPQVKVASAENARITYGAQAVLLQPADNVEIIPDLEGSVGLLAAAVGDAELPDLSSYQQQPLVYLSQPNLEEDSPVKIAGSVKIRKRSVLVASTTKIQLEEKYASFEQRLDYQVAYEPVRQLTLTVPGIIRRPENLRIFLQATDIQSEDTAGSSVLPWSIIPRSENTGTGSEPLEIENISVDLLAEYTGALRIILKYQEQLPLLMADSSQRVNFLLVSPAVEDVRLVQNDVTINTQDIFVSEPADDLWQVVRGVASEESSGDRLRLQASDATTSLPVQMRMRRDISRTSTLIQRRWVQTALLNDQCRERLAFQIRTNESDLRIQFPPRGVDPSTLIVAINNQRVPVDLVVLDSQQELTIRLASSNVESDYRVELWYMRSGFDSQQLSLPLPTVVNSKMSGSTYWQIVTTNSQHLLGTPRGWTPEYDWSWSGLYWFRASALGQSDLEQWVGASTQLALPENTNQYLLSTVGEEDTLSASITSRSTLLLWISGMVLGIGLIILKLPVLQHPMVIFSVGIVSALVAVWVPELMLLVMQAAFLGIALVVVARILDWIISGPRIQTTAIKRGNHAQDTNSEAIALLKLNSSMATVEKEENLDDSQQQQA